MKIKFDILHNFISPVTGRIFIGTNNYILVGNKQGIGTPSPALIDVRLDIINLKRTIEELSELKNLTYNNIWIGDHNNQPVPQLRIAVLNLPVLGAATFPYPDVMHLPPVPIPNPTFNPISGLDWLMSGPWLPQIYAGSANTGNTSSETIISSSLAMTEVNVAQAIKRLDVTGFVLKSRHISFTWENPAMLAVPAFIKSLYGLNEAYTFTNAQALEELGSGLLHNDLTGTLSIATLTPYSCWVGDATSKPTESFAYVRGPTVPLSEGLPLPTVPGNLVMWAAGVPFLTGGRDIADSEFNVSQLIAMEGQIEALQGQVSTLETQVATLQGQVETLQAQLAAVEADVAGLDAAVIALQVQVAGIEADVAGLDASVAAIEAEIVVIEGEIAAMQAQITVLEGEVAALQAQVTVLEGEVAALQAQVTVLEGEVAALQAQVTALEADVAAIDASIAAIEASITTLQGQVATLEGQMITVLADITTLQAAVAANTAAIVACNLRIDNLRLNTIPADGDVSFYNYKLINLGNGTNPTDGINLGQLDARITYPGSTYTFLRGDGTWATELINTSIKLKLNATDASAFNGIEFKENAAINLTIGYSNDSDYAVIASATSINLYTGGSGSPAVTINNSGNITTGNWNASIVGLAYGGTNANLTASNGGIVYSTASALAILATANDGVLITSGSGIPSISTTIPLITQQNITRFATNIVPLSSTSTQSYTFDSSQATTNYKIINSSTVVAPTLRINQFYLQNSGGVALKLEFRSYSADINGFGTFRLNFVGTSSTRTPLTVFYDQYLYSNYYFQFTGVVAFEEQVEIWNNITMKNSSIVDFSGAGSVLVPDPYLDGQAVNKGFLDGKFGSVNQYAVLVGGASNAIVSLSVPTVANKVLLSGASANPSWSTATYPATTTVNQLLYSSSANTITGLSSANNGALVTDGSGVPSISSTLPSAVQGNITTLGTVTSGTWNATNIALNRGGTNASLTASNGGIVYSTASALAISAVGTAGYTLFSGGAGAPVWNVSTTQKASCRLATTGNLTATYSNGTGGVGATLTNSGALGSLIVDGFVGSAGDRILVKDQSSDLQNGIYIVTNAGSGSVAWVLTRSTDYNGSSGGAISKGDTVLVYGGNSNLYSTWVMSSPSPVIGTNTISFSAILPASNTPNRVLLSGSIGFPSYSTATYPGTTTVNQLLYSSANNTVTGLGTANSSILATNGSGVPAFTTTLPFTVPVITGGTGLTSTTAYGVICGGTTATAAFQNAGAGNIGEVFVSNGSSALPSFQSRFLDTYLVSRNIFIGTSAGNLTLTGTDNLCIGSVAGLRLTTGSSNTLLGYGVGINLLGGSSNVAIGGHFTTPALLNATTATNTVAIGIGSGKGYASYTNCTFLGAFADSSINGLTNAAAIGYNASVSISNALILGSGCNVGIGTSSPSQAGLVVSKYVQNVGTEASCIRATSAQSSTKIEIDNTSASGHLWEIRSLSAGDFDIVDRTGTISSFFIKGTTGRVGISNSNPLAKLDIIGGVQNIANEETALRVYPSTTVTDIKIELVWYKNWAIKSRSNGEFAIGAGNVAGDRALMLDLNNALYLNSAFAYKFGTASWTVVSDKKTKKNIKTYDKGLKDIVKLDVKKFKYTEEFEKDLPERDKGKEHTGLIAQEVQAVFPDSVWEYEGNLTFNPHEVNMCLINAVKELNAKIMKLEQQLTR